MKKFFLFFFLTVILISSVNATYLDGQFVALNLTVDENNNYIEPSFTAYNEVYDDKMIFDGASTYMDDQTYYLMITNLTTWSMAMTLEWNSVANFDRLYMERSDASGLGVIFTYYNGNYNIEDQLGVADLDTSGLNAGDDDKVVLMYDGSKYIFFKDGVNELNVTRADSTNNKVANKITIGKNAHTGSGYFDGNMTQFCLWNRVLTTIEVQNYTDSGCNLEGAPPPGDSTPPVISTPIQNPSNVTILNVMTTHVNITSNITDETSLNLSTILLNITYNDTIVFVNGTIITSEGKILTFNSSKNDEYSWILDESDLVSATYNINHEIMEDTVHSNFTLTGLNSWLKIEFLNVSNTRQQSFVEYMDINATGVISTSDYYYCNSNYTTGNPVSSEWCVIFFSRLNNLPFNHTHLGDKSSHRFLPMGINTSSGTIGDVYVTPISFILKRGTVTGDSIFYIDDSLRNSAELSNNNGNVWNTQTYTVDAHIHQISENESFSYQVCAKDDSENEACSIIQSDKIDFPKFPPNAITIFNPVARDYNDTIIINHSVSFSASGQTILTYKYEFSVEGSESFTEITINNHPTTTFEWDISNFLNNNYFIRITINDSLGLTTIQNSEVFTIENDLTVDQQLLTIINNTLLSVVGGINLIAITFLFMANWGVFLWNMFKKHDFALYLLTMIMFLVISVQYKNLDMAGLVTFCLLSAVINLQKTYDLLKGKGKPSVLNT